MPGPKNPASSSPLPQLQAKIPLLTSAPLPRSAQSASGMGAHPAPAPPASDRQARHRLRAHGKWDPAHSCSFAADDRVRPPVEFPCYGVLRPNLADRERNLGLADSDSTKEAMPNNESNVTFTLTLTPVNQQRALSFKRSKLRRIAEPSPAINFRRGSPVDNPLMPHIRKSRHAEKLRPFLRKQQLRWHGQQRPPLVAMQIVPVIIDQNPSSPARPQYPQNLANPRCRLRPVICRLHRYRMVEKIRFPGNFPNFPGSIQNIFEVQARAPRHADHRIRNIHPHHAALRHALRQPPRQPPRPAPHIQNSAAPRQPQLLHPRP